jgi:hypothetical protein
VKIRSMRMAIGNLLRSGRGKKSRGQILVLAVVIFFLFFIVATVLIDVYILFESRNWGYRVAQQAALAGTSYTATKWMFLQPTVDPTAPTPTPGGCIDPVRVELEPMEAENAAEQMLLREMGTRGMTYPADFDYAIEVHEDSYGGTTANWPPYPVRLGVISDDWETANAAIGVYLSFHVDTFLLSAIGITPGDIHVFAAAEAANTPMCP